MSLAFPSALLLLSAALCCLLGVGVILRNPHKRTHRAFGVLTLNLALWALGVFLIIHSHEAARARFWVIATFIVAAPCRPTTTGSSASFPGNASKASGDYRYTYTPRRWWCPSWPWSGPISTSRR